MKKTLLTMAASLALVSCSQDDLMTGIENRPTGAIGAKVFVPTVSRGTALNNEGDLVTAGNGFDLYAFLVKDNSQFMGAVADGNNVGVPFVGSGTEGSYVWNYENESQMRFWSEADESDIKFFAVSPKNALTEGFLTKTISHDSQAFAYTTPETCSEQVDLMYGVTAEPKYSSTTGEHLENGISLQFRHALSQIVFKAKTESELIYADVTAVKIKNVYKTGSFDVATAETYRTAEDKSTTTFPWKDYADLKDFTAQLGETAPTNINTTVDEEGNETTTSEKETGNYQDGRLTDSSEALLLIPQNLESNKAVLAITCSVRYKRGEGDEATIVDNQTIEVPVTTHWQPGYKYTYTLIFTAEMGNPIKVMTVGVDIWNDAGDTDVNVDDEGKKELTQAEKNALLVANNFVMKNAATVSSTGVTFIESYSTTQDGADVNNYFSYDNLSTAGVLNSVITSGDDYYRMPTAGELMMLVPAEDILCFNSESLDSPTTTVTETVYLENTSDNCPNESGKTITGESVFNISTTECYDNGNSEYPLKAYVVYALRFKGTEQYAAYRYEYYTMQSDDEGNKLNALKIQIKALGADDETTSIDNVSNEEYWASDYIEVVIPATSFCNDYNSFYDSTYGTNGMLLSNTKSQTESEDETAQSFVIWFDDNGAKVYQDSYGTHMTYPVRLLQCDSEGNF